MHAPHVSPFVSDQVHLPEHGGLPEKAWSLNSGAGGGGAPPSLAAPRNTTTFFANSHHSDPFDAASPQSTDARHGMRRTTASAAAESHPRAAGPQGPHSTSPELIGRASHSVSNFTLGAMGTAYERQASPASPAQALDGRGTSAAASPHQADGVHWARGWQAIQTGSTHQNGLVNHNSAHAVHREEHPPARNSTLPVSNVSRGLPLAAPSTQGRPVAGAVSGRVGPGVSGNGRGEAGPPYRVSSPGPPETPSWVASLEAPTHQRDSQGSPAAEALGRLEGAWTRTSNLTKMPEGGEEAGQAGHRNLTPGRVGIPHGVAVAPGGSPHTLKGAAARPSSLGPAEVPSGIAGATAQVPCGLNDGPRTLSMKSSGLSPAPSTLAGSPLQ